MVHDRVVYRNVQEKDEDGDFNRSFSIFQPGFSRTVHAMVFPDVRLRDTAYIAFGEDLYETFHPDPKPWKEPNYEFI